MKFESSSIKVSVKVIEPIGLLSIMVLNNRFKVDSLGISEGRVKVMFLPKKTIFNNCLLNEMWQQISLGIWFSKELSKSSNSRCFQVISSISNFKFKANF